jgi:hypothetical protein
MSNTLTGLIPVIYEAFDEVARERIGLISKVTQDATAAQAAVGQVVRSFVTNPSQASDITPGAYAPNTGGQVLNYNDIVITNAKAVPIQWTGEEMRAVGGEFQSMYKNQIVQAIRTLSNAIESTLATTIGVGASRATGTAGVTPFGVAGDLSDSAGVLKVLDDNGAPFADLAYVANNATIANFRGKQSVLFKVNEAGTDELLRKGIVGNLQGMAIGQSAALSKVRTAGTGTGWVANGGNAIGDTSINLHSGTGTIVAGDIITFAGDTNQYVVAADLTGGVVTINKPGMVKALADGVAVTVEAASPFNIALHPQSTILLARAPVMPVGGDAAVDVIDITDPVSGLTFQFADYRQYRQSHFEIGMAWGAKVVKPEFVCLSLSA